MSQWTQEDVDRLNAKRGASMPAHVKPSKYRNVKTVVDGEKFDSKREANYWHELKIRERAGEITNLRRQVPFPLCCPQPSGPGSALVSNYVADFVFNELSGELRVVDAKGKRTQMYLLKRKWLELQTNLIIEEV